MDLPAFLPKNLAYASSETSDRNLLQRLMQSPKDLIAFFEYACDDETWSEAHADFMKEAIAWITQQFYQDKLFADLAARAAVKIREHSSLLLAFVPTNLTISFNGAKKEVNSLLWGASSEYLRNMIRQQCRDKETQTLDFEDLHQVVFDQINEFLCTGTVEKLPTKDQHEILEVLKKARQWGLADLESLCQEQLKKYVTRSNVVEILLQAHEEDWDQLKCYCIDVINGFDAGVRFSKTPPGVLAMEFLNFHGDALDIFQICRFYITHLRCDHNLTDQEEFSDLIHRCPNLISLDISGSHSFSDRLLDIPDTLNELDLSSCEWLSHKELDKIINICPNLLSLHLANNTQLRYSSWSLLTNLARLESLDISRCGQISDSDFKLILQACRHITNLSIKGCHGLSDLTFLELGELMSELTDLDVSKTHITDEGLIAISIHCKHLISLRASQCPDVTPKGILEAVENASKLKQLQIAQSDMSSGILEEIKEIRPFLRLILE